MHSWLEGSVEEPLGFQSRDAPCCIKFEKQSDDVTSGYPILAKISENVCNYNKIKVGLLQRKKLRRLAPAKHLLLFNHIGLLYIMACLFAHTPTPCRTGYIFYSFRVSEVHWRMDNDK